MMFGAQQVLDSVKSMQLADAPTDLSHCQYLRYSAQKLGFNSYESLKSYLQNPPRDRIGKVHTQLMRKVCSLRLPTAEKDYVYLTSYGHFSFGFYSQWIGWDCRGNEIRVPRADCFRDRIAAYREYFPDPVYVIETMNELLSWQFLWQANAIIPYELAETAFKSLFNKKHRVAKKPPIDLIKRNVQRELQKLQDRSLI